MIECTMLIKLNGKGFYCVKSFVIEILSHQKVLQFKESRMSQMIALLVFKEIFEDF